MNEESKFKKRIRLLPFYANRVYFENLSHGIPNSTENVWGKAIDMVLDEVRKDIFPLPTGDIITDPITHERHQILLDFKDWLAFINNLRKWFGDAEK